MVRVSRIFFFVDFLVLVFSLFSCFVIWMLGWIVVRHPSDSSLSLLLILSLLF